MVFERFCKGVLLLVVVALVGCSNVGLNLPRDEGPSTAEFRYEVELIPNAELVRDNTSPDWQLGRYSFRRGADRLLVVSRFTSSMEKKAKKKGQAPQRSDWKKERVWITLPLGTPIGEVLALEELERSFLVGYDEGELENGSYRMFRQPNKVLGRLKVLLEHPDSVHVSLNMRVEPKRSPSWNFRNDKLMVPITVSGIHAMPTEDAYVPSPYKAVLPASTNATQGDAGVGHASGSSGALQDDVVGPEDDETRSVVGKWEMGLGVWEHRLQFDSDGTFIHGSTRGIKPMIKEGHYAVRSGFVVLTYEKFYSQMGGSTKSPEGGGNHIQFLKKKVVALRPQWIGTDLILHGELRASGGSSPYRLRPGTYTDLRIKGMPTKKRAGFGANQKEYRSNQ